MRKFKMFFDKDKETQWLNEMSAQGYALNGFFFGVYSFDKCEPGKYTYQIDITGGWFRVENAYREFMNEMDVEIVTLWGPWVILRKHAEDGPFEMYTDVESRIAHYEKIKKLFKMVTILEIFGLFLEILAALDGIAMGWFFACTIAALVVVFVRQIAKINDILIDLKSKIGENTEGLVCRGRRNLSGFVSIGFLLNACGFLVSGGQNEFLKVFFHGLAIVCFIVGIVHMLWKKKD